MPLARRDRELGAVEQRRAAEGQADVSQLQVGRHMKHKLGAARAGATHRAPAPERERSMTADRRLRDRLRRASRSPARRRCSPARSPISSPPIRARASTAFTRSSTISCSIIPSSAIDADARPAARARRGGRRRGQARRDVPRRARQFDRAARRRCTWPCAISPARRSSSTATTSTPEVAAERDKMLAFAAAVREGRVRGAQRPADSPTSSISASAAPTSARRWRRARSSPFAPAGPARAFRLQRRRRRHRRHAARARPGAHPVHRLVQDLHHAGDDDQRADRARLDRRARSARRRSPTISPPSRRSSTRSPNSASRPTACSASGTGSAGAIRSGRRSACRWRSPSARSSFDEFLARRPRGRRSISATRRSERNIPVLMGLLGVWYRNVSAIAVAGGHPLRPAPGALPRLSPAA